jgi:hypothetical protein
MPAVEAEPSPVTDTATVRPVELDDLPAIWRFCSRYYDVFHGCSFDDFRAVWHHRWLDNPAARADQPKGWLLENDAADVVGFGGIVPMRIKIGAQAHTAMCGANWYVQQAYRRHSLALFRRYRSLAAEHVVLSTSLSSAAAAVHARAMLPIPVKDIDQALWWIIDSRRFFDLKLTQLAGTSRPWALLAAAKPALGLVGMAWPALLGFVSDPQHRVLPWLARARIAFDVPPLPVELSTGFGDEFDLFWHEHRQRYDVTMERTSAFLDWRHRQLPKAAGRAFVLACRDRGRLVGYVALQTPGTRSDRQIPGCFNVTDLVYPAERPDVLGNLMNAAFRFAVEHGGVVLKLSGFHPEVRAALASQRPCVIEPDMLQRLARGTVGQRVFARLGRARRTKRAAGRGSGGSYWYKNPDPALADICAGGT